MDRKQRRAYYREHHQYLATLSATLTLVPESEWPPYPKKPIKIWRSKHFLVQLWDASTAAYPGMLRLSVCRSAMRPDGHWEDGITWDELQAIKRELGYGDRYAVEIYPRDKDIEYVANFRHLWLPAEPLDIGWIQERR